MGFGGHSAQASVKAHPREDAGEGKPELRAVVGRAHSLWIFSFWNVASRRACRAASEPKIQRASDGLDSETVSYNVKVVFSACLSHGASP